jgi:hypothetical protein
MSKEEMVRIIETMFEETGEGQEDFLEFLEYELDQLDPPVCLETFLIEVFKEFVLK